MNDWSSGNTPRHRPYVPGYILSANLNRHDDHHRKKNIVTAIAALSNVVRDSREYISC
jgi:hypothetical protein